MIWESVSHTQNVTVRCIEFFLWAFEVKVFANLVYWDYNSFLPTNEILPFTLLKIQQIIPKPILSKNSRGNFYLI